MRVKNDVSGKVFGRLTVLEPDGKTKHGSTIWKCRCSCNAERTVNVVIGNLTSGSVQSCGCLRVESGRRVGQSCRTHGMSKTRVYGIWTWMHERCRNPDHEAYEYYGGKGISVEPVWHTFEQFYADMGEPPSARHTLDRLDSDGNYGPGNCRWALPVQQMNNTSRNIFLDYDGRSQTIAEWARECDINVDTLRYRLRKGWSTARALNKESV